MKSIISVTCREIIIFSLAISIGLLIPGCASGGDLEGTAIQLETPEPTQVKTPTITPSPRIIEETSTPTHTPPSETSPPAASAPRIGGGLQQSLALGAEEIRDLWIDAEGQLWIASELGIHQNEDGNWELRSNQPANQIMGVDASGNIWVILDDGTAIGSYDLDGSWSIYGSAQGWIVPPEVEYLSPGYGDGLVTDTQGGVWLATGRDDVRRFDPVSQSWQVFQATDIGYRPIPGDNYQGHFLTDVELSRSQKVWVGDCIGKGEKLEGQGIRWTDGDSWFEAPDTSGECVQDIEIDAGGKMWVGGFDALLMYDPDAGTWTRYPLPTWDRRQLVTDITLDWDGNPWIEVMQYGGAGPLGKVVRYHLTGNEWRKDFEGWFSSLVFADQGLAWLCSEGSIFRLENGKIENAGDIEGSECEIVVDGSGRVWVTNYTSLWFLDP